MDRRHAFRNALAIVAVAILATAAAADDAAPPEAASESPSPEEVIAAAIEIDTAAAKAALKRSADFLAEQERFGFSARLRYDVVQANGQKLQFGGTRKVTVRRPDRLRMEATTREGERRTVYFDGEKISIDLPEEEAYVSVSKPGTLDAAIDYLVDDLETPAPLHEFLKTNFYTDVADNIRSGYYVGSETLGEQNCDHLAFRLPEVDVQIWIAEGEKPLPCAVVITYKREAQSPQFGARFEDWDLSPKASDKVFDFEPSKGAERITFLAATAAAGEAE